MMENVTTTTQLPLVVLRTANKKPTANQTHLLERLGHFNVRTALVGHDRINLSTGALTEGEDQLYSLDNGVVAAGDVANVVWTIKRLPLDLRGTESKVPFLNPDYAFWQTADKLATWEALGELTVPTRLIIGHDISVEESNQILATASTQWGQLVIKEKMGSMGRNVAIGTAAELASQLAEFRALEGQPNFIIQPFLDGRRAFKPYLPEELQDRPTSLRVIGGFFQLPGQAPVAKIFTAFYRYGHSSVDMYHDGHDNNHYLQQPNQSIEESHPQLQACFDLVKQALAKGSVSQAAKAHMTNTKHGIVAQICSVDLLILPKDAPYGFIPKNGNVEYKTIVMEQNSCTSRFNLSKHDPTRNAWHDGEARLMASIAHGRIIESDGR